MEPYIFIIGLPISRYYQGITHGYNAEGTDFTYSTCDHTSQNHFAFYANANNETPIFQIHEGMTYRWKTKAKSVPISALLTDEFIYFFEIHFAGCGGITTCNAWQGCKGASPGFIFGKYVNLSSSISKLLSQIRFPCDVVNSIDAHVSI